MPRWAIRRRWGASGRNGGQALVGFGFTGQEAIEVQLSPDDARRAWDISVEGLQQLRSLIAKHHIDCDYVPGHLSLALNKRKSHALDRWIGHLSRRYDYQLQPISHDDIGGWIDSTRFHSGAFDAQSGHLHPLKYCLGLAAAARQAGAAGRVRPELRHGLADRPAGG